MGKVILVILAAGALVGIGRCSAPDHTKTETKTVVVHAPGKVTEKRTTIVKYEPLPEVCQAAIKTVMSLSANDVGIDKSIGSLDTLLDQLAVPAYKGDQQTLNKLFIKINRIKETVGGTSADSIDLRNQLDSQLTDCKEKLK